MAVAPGSAPAPAGPAPRYRRPERDARHREPEGTRAMNHLLRELAPITDAGWEELEEEARQHLAVHLAARKLVDFSGPHGWERSATNLGRTEPLSPDARRGRRRPPAQGPPARRDARLVQPLARRARARRQGRRRRRLRPARRGRAADRAGREHGRLQRLAAGRDHRDRRGVAARPAPADRRHERVPGPGRGRGRDPDVQRHRGPVRPRARARRLQARGRDDRARRLPALRPPAQDHRRPDRLGARRRTAHSW